MPDKLYHPDMFTVQVDRLRDNHETVTTIAGYAEERIINCGFVMLRGAVVDEELESLQHHTQRAEKDFDAAKSWSHGWLGRTRFVELSELSDDEPLRAGVLESMRPYIESTVDLTMYLRRDNRRARTSMLRPRTNEIRGELSLDGRAVTEVWQDDNRKALTQLRPGDALVLVGGSGLKYRTWNTTRRIDSDEHARRYGVSFRAQKADRDKRL